VSYRHDHRAAGAAYPYGVHDCGSCRYYARRDLDPQTNGHCILVYVDLGSGSSARTQFRY